MVSRLKNLSRLFKMTAPKNERYMHILLIFGFVFLTSAQGQTPPLDSLYASDSLGIGSRILLKPIQWWQHFSYANPSMNCQFEKSCSNFMVQAVQEKGPIRGVIVGTDRIVRCNPFARHYHVQRPGAEIQYDGRLVEPLNWQPEYPPGKSPLAAATLSLMPGLGRAYAGHPWDGVFSFILVGAFAFNTCQHSQADNPFMAGINGSLMLLFWSADIYGAYRTAQLAPPHKP
jgi:putative component of membrane protein insertase Oxa1/YidC/SpoIIIJ protein YidD